MKHKFDKKRVSWTFIYFVLALSTFLIWYTSSDETIQRYVRQALFIAAVVFTILFFRSLKKAIPESLKIAVKSKIARGYNFIMKYVNKYLSAIKRFFGIPEIQLLRGKDESSFIFDIEDTALFRKLHQLKNTLRWRDLEENADKIRYIYIKYIVKLMRKGFKFRVQYTPYEISAKMKLADEEAHFIELYNYARYSGGRRGITNADVEDSMKYAK